MQKPNNLNDSSFENLKKLIIHFKKTSNVILIRTPVVNEFYEFENNKSPRFNYLIDSLSKKNGVRYINLNTSANLTNNLDFYDLHHLNKKHSNYVSKKMEKLIDSMLVKN